MLGNVTHDNYLLPTTLRHATNTGRGMGAILQGIESGWPGKTAWTLRHIKAPHGKLIIGHPHNSTWDYVIDYGKGHKR
jgi:hypothetical protein